MANTKYKKRYSKDVLEYFLRFIDMRDDPDLTDAATVMGMPHIAVEDGKAIKQTRPCSGYPTLTKFAIKIGISPRTISNWRAEFPEFDEACEFCENIFEDVLDERALSGTVDGRVAMKIRELKQNAKRESSEGGLGGAGKVVIEIHDDREDVERIVAKEWTGEINEDVAY